jgi:hypothetical protein
MVYDKGNVGCFLGEQLGIRAHEFSNHRYFLLSFSSGELKF